MDKKLIIGLVGLLASGKGTVAKYLKEERSASVFRFSTPLRDVLDRLKIEESRTNLQKISTLLRQNFSEDILAKIIYHDTQESENDLVVIDGIRRWDDIKHLQKKDNFILVGVEADEKTRFKRLRQRAENKGDSQKTYEEFLADQEKEADAEIPHIIKKATNRINNNNTMQDLYKNIENLLAEYEK